MRDLEKRKSDAFARGKRLGEANDIKLYLTGKALFQEEAPYAHHLRRAALDRAIFAEYPLEIDERELLIGRFAAGRELAPEERELAEAARRYLRAGGRLAGAYPAATGHRVIDYERLLNAGVASILREVAEKRALIDYSRSEDAAKAAFYEAVEISLNAFVALCARARETLAARAAKSADPVRRAELLRMADNFSRAPLEKCEHFYEAVQIMWMMQFALCLVDDVSLTGRFDNYMWPFYERDLRAGAIDEAFAFEIIRELYMKHNEIYDAWPATIMVGGVDREGKPVWNALTRLCIEAIPATGLINPSVNVSYTPDMPEELLDRCLEIIAQGYTRPAFFNDRVIRAGLLAAGMTERDSRYYINSTCVEITPVAASNVQVATPYINLNKAFEYIFNGGQSVFGEECRVKPAIPVDLNALKTFADFRALAEKVVRGIIRANLEEVCRRLYGHSQYSASPLASAFIDDCLARGLDAGAGGARYSYVYPCFPGFLNLVDALAAVRRAVYEEGVATLAEMGAALRDDFAGAERLRQYLLNRCPKIGNGIEAVDRLGVEMYELIREELGHYTTSVGASFHPSYFAWIMHGVLGRQAAATPDGRRQGTALSECLGAVQGMDRRGPTGILRSIEKIDQKYGIGGIATNLRFTKKLMASPEGRAAVKGFIKTFMARDCFEVQFNVVDQKELLEAKERPEAHRTLMVRVAGYSDYFVNLSAEIQDEIIKRSEHEAV